MSQSTPTIPDPQETESLEALPAQLPSEAEPATSDSYVKLAMRNMVRKGGQSLRHFALTLIGLVTLLVGLSYLTR